MSQIIVSYSVNSLAETGRILFSDKTTVIESEHEDDETALHKEALEKVSKLEGVSEIKITGFMKVR